MAHLSMNSPLGPLTLFAERGALVAVEWGAAAAPRAAPLLSEAKAQLDAYFGGRLEAFDLPLRPEGTPFQRRLWARLRDIPYRRVLTYGQLAASLGSAARCIGGACGRNPIPIIIPCHRVVGAGGHLGGYSGGAGVETKRALLRLEGLPLGDGGWKTPAATA